MAKLSAASRAKVPQSQFGVPSKAGSAGAKKKSGNFPIPDKNHARAALSLIGNASPSERPAIRAKANAMLGKKGAKTAPKGNPHGK
jgi:hypothetical protein